MFAVLIAAGTGVLSAPLAIAAAAGEMPELWGVPLIALTTPTLLGIAILMVLTGRLVPRSTYDDKAEEANKWQAAHKVSEEARLSQTRQMDAVMEVGETVKNVLTALERVRLDEEP
jgi:hypothetical protein